MPTVRLRGGPADGLAVADDRPTIWVRCRPTLLGPMPIVRDGLVQTVAEVPSTQPTMDSGTMQLVAYRLGERGYVWASGRLAG